MAGTGRFMKRNPAEVLFASAVPERLDRQCTLPALFQRLLERMPIKDRVRGCKVAIKMLVDHVKGGRPKDVFVTDGSIEGASDRGYTQETIGARLVPASGKDGKDVAVRRTGWPHLKTVQLGRPVLEADVLINFAHVKGHGDCGFGGACKNLAMGCVPPPTRGAMHMLEGDLKWNKIRCVHCKKCIAECPTGAAQFNDKGEFSIFWHNCKGCQHCMLICPAKAIRMSNRNFSRFQEGLARVAKLVLDNFEPSRVFHINMLTQITIFCDCWGLTTPSLVPDIGAMASEDIVAVEQASLEAIQTRNLIPGSITPPFTLGKGKHLFEKLHHRDPFQQVRALEKLSAGTSRHRLVPVRADALPTGAAGGH